MGTSRINLDCQTLTAQWSSPRWYTPEGQVEFRAFYEAETGGDRLHAAAIDDAAMFVHRYCWQQMLARNYAAAEGELRRFFTHPYEQQADCDYRTELICQLALCCLAQKRESEGMAFFRSVLDSEERHVRWVAERFTGNQLLWGLFPILEREGLASEALTGLAVELAARIRGQKFRRNRFPRRTSYAKLRRLLRKTYPPNRYPPIRGRDRLDTALLMCEEALRQIRAENTLVETDA